jgi:two-component system phosphate regulon sensor histidine kinase PhoR
VADDVLPDALAQDRAALEEIRARVMNVVGHALRTPMATVRGQVEVLSRTTDPAQRAELIESLLRSSRRLERLLDDVLVAARIETRLPVAQRENVLVGDALRVVWGELGSDRDLVVGGDPTATVYVAPDGLRWMLRHVVDNAVRYGTGAVLVDVIPGDGQVTIAVGGPGPELPDEELENAFELFYRGHHAVMLSAARLGVGLTVARRLAEFAGGGITLRRRSRGGTEAVLELPSR